MAVSEVERASGARRRYEDLPGPRGLPIVGNARSIKVESLHKTVEAWAGEYGDIYRFRVGARRFVGLSDPELIAKVLRDRPDGFQRGSRLVEISRAFGMEGVFAANGAAWRRQRPMVLASLDPAHIKSFFPTLTKVTGRLAGRWHQAAATSTPIDLQADLMRYTVDVTASLAFGTDMNTLESDGEVIQQHLDKVFPALMKRAFAAVPYWRWILLPEDRRVLKHLRALHRAVGDFVSQARKRISEQPQLREHPSNLIEALVAARDREGSAVTDEDVSGNVLTMLLAGEDTTANTLAWMIWLLQTHPEAKQRAADEARRVLAGQPCLASSDQLGSLDYIEACANETMRLKPVAPINVAEAVHDTVIADVAIPAGTLVMCVMRRPAVDQRHFPDPTAFRPERWLSDGSVQSIVSTAKRVAMPFGAGPRVCPGRYLALAEIKSVIAMLLGSFEVHEVAGPDGQDVVERMSLTMSPVGLRMRLG